MRLLRTIPVGLAMANHDTFEPWVEVLTEEINDDVNLALVIGKMRLERLGTWRPT